MKSEKKRFIGFLLYSFIIAWGAELALIFLYNINLIRGVPMQIIHFCTIGFGAGMAPAYAALIVKKKDSVNLQSFIKDIFKTANLRQCIIVLVVFAIIQLVACVVQEEYIGNPWYFFILYMPIMLLGGGLEEVGWQDVFQPLLQNRFPFLISTVIGGVIWSIWHLPLWFVPNTSQSSYSFAAFTLFCITLETTLAAAHRITKSIWVSVLLHAWSNTILGGMYSLTSLCSFPDFKTCIVHVLQILLIVFCMHYALLDKGLLSYWTIRKQE